MARLREWLGPPLGCVHRNWCWLLPSKKMMFLAVYPMKFYLLYIFVLFFSFDMPTLPYPYSAYTYISYMVIYIYVWCMQFVFSIIRFGHRIATCIFRGAHGCAMPRESGPKPSVTLKEVLEGEISTFKEDFFQGKRSLQKDNIKPWVLCLGCRFLIHPDTWPGCWRMSWKALGAKRKSCRLTVVYIIFVCQDVASISYSVIYSFHCLFGFFCRWQLLEPLQYNDCRIYV